MATSIVAETLEVHRFPVDEEVGPPHLDGADADRLVVRVDHVVPVDELDLEVVQVPVARSPPVHVGHGQHPGCALSGRHRRPLGIAQDDPNLRPVSADGDDLVCDGAGRFVQPGDDRHVVHVRRGRGQ